MNTEALGPLLLMDFACEQAQLLMDAKELVIRGKEEATAPKDKYDNPEMQAMFEATVEFIDTCLEGALLYKHKLAFSLILHQNRCPQ